MIYLIESHNLLSAKNWGNWTSYLVLRREGRAAARGGGGVGRNVGRERKKQAQVHIN